MNSPIRFTNPKPMANTMVVLVVSMIRLEKHLGTIYPDNIYYIYTFFQFLILKKSAYFLAFFNFFLFFSAII